MKLTINVQHRPKTITTTQIVTRTLEFFYGDKEDSIEYINNVFSSDKHRTSHHLNQFREECIELINDAEIVKNKK